MSKTVLSEVEGFTPVIDAMVDELGLMTAVVFGRIWRYCQMEDKVCKASLESIAEGIGVDKATVMRHANKLCEAGYLVDLTPELRNRPHVYADTGKAGLAIKLSGVAGNNTKKPTVAQRNVTVAENNDGVAESQLNKDIKKDLKIPPGLTEKQLEQANAKVTAMIENSKKVTYRNRSRLPEQYLMFGDLYFELTKQEPTKSDLMDWMSTFEEWKQKGLQPEHIRAAFSHASRDGGFPVGRPGSLTNTAVGMRTKMIASPAPHVDETAVEATKQMIEKKTGGDFVPRPAGVPAPAIIKQKLQDLSKQKGLRR